MLYKRMEHSVAHNFVLQEGIYCSEVSCRLDFRCDDRTRLKRNPIGFAGKWIGWQADPTPSLPSIEMLPFYPESLDPKRQQFLILATLEPFANSFLHGLLQFFVSTEECCLLPYLSPIPLSFPLWLLKIPMQLLC